MRYFTIVFFTVLLSSAVIAQDECSAFVTDALASVDTLCEATGRNELCYGNNIVSVTTVTGDELNFSQPGDIVPINQIDSIRTNPYAEPDEWGIALMKLQANIPDSLPGQNVTFLLFGDASLTSAIPADETAPSLSARTTNTINVRSGPSTNNAVIDSLQANTAIKLIGRNAAGDWVYFTADNRSGWLFASLLQIDGDVMTLNEVADDFAASSTPSPMQAVYFSSGIGESSCSEVPQDGILIQTPDYKEPIELVINDTQISLGSTVYLQAEANNAMSLYVLEGQATVTADSETQVVPQGSFTTVPIDENLHATGSPTKAESYDMNTIESVPISNLDEAIVIAEPASDDVLQTAHNQSLVAGYWTNTDTDGSSQWMLIQPTHDGSFNVTYRDEGASVCGKDASGTPIHAANGDGTGMLDGTEFTVNMNWACEGGNGRSGTITIHYTINSNGSMTDDSGLVWTR